MFTSSPAYEEVRVTVLPVPTLALSNTPEADIDKLSPLTMPEKEALLISTVAEVDAS